jgi:hypothetical protein
VLQQEQESQPYDRALKSLMGDEAAEILPNLLPEAELVREENIEIDRTMLKADLVYNILYKGLPHILNMELQTDADSKMSLRMLKYHVGLLDKHDKPVISVILYPFETSLPEPPYREMSGEEALLTFHYKVVSLWKMEAEPFVRNHIVCMYTFLPAMKGVTAPMLIQAIEEMELRYAGYVLGSHLIRFRTILRRSKIVSAQDKQLVEKKMHTFDSLLDQDPYLQEQRVLERTLGRNEGLTEGIQTMRDTIVEIVQRRFPTLVELAQKRVEHMQRLDQLKQLNVDLSTAPNQTSARRILKRPAVD